MIIARRVRDLAASRPWIASFGLLGFALVVRAVLADELTVMLPFVVLAGVFCGIRPAAGAAAIGAVVGLVSTQQHVPAFGAVVFAAAAALSLWAISVVRRDPRRAEAEARLAEVFRQIPGAAAIIAAPEGRTILNSRMSDEILGHGRQTLRSTDDMKTFRGVHPDGRPYAAEEYPIVRALRNGEIVRGEPLRYLRPDGFVDLEVHAGPVRDPRGRIVGAVGIALDVTDRVRAAEQSRAREASFRALSERLNTALDVGELGMWEIDLTTRVTVWDARFASMLGLKPEPIELSREAGQSFFATEDEARALAEFEQALASGQPYASEFRAKAADGRTRWLLMRGVVSVQAGTGFGIVRDVTEQHEREDALRAAIAAREVLLQEADHRIKNSLQLVVSMLRLTQSRMRDTEAATALGDAITRVYAVADAHRALEGSRDLRTIDVAAMVSELCARLGLLNPAIVLDCLASGPIDLPADRAIPLGLILNEILTNALRHAYPPGEAGRVHLDVRATAGVLEVTVADEGLGIPAEGARRGLGSRVVSALAQQIGATETRVSETGRGTCVSLRLRVEETPA